MNFAELQLGAIKANIRGNTVLYLAEDFSEV